MSGHSKWSTIKRKKAAEDAKRGKVFTRLARELTMAARQGGGDPEMNPTLRLAMDKAKASNMPKDNIERAIIRGTGEGDDDVVLEELTYEGYGPHGVAVLVDVVTDNKNRTLAEVKHTFAKSNGNMASAGSVMWQFDQKGLVSVTAEGTDFDELFLMAADAGAENVEDDDDVYAVTTPREELANVAQALNAAGFTVVDYELTWVPKNEVSLDTDAALQVMKLIERMEELDDVQSVSSNLDITDEALDALQAA
ncbi:MAG: YebC/PmpR family DNA-binding transcriptional regulator [Anaerolineae bacterium]|nr:YebC/PmpR family DNA-binding transcriptional regulator [Anaerolineae bacterium]